MDDVSKLGPLWVSQLKKEVAARRNRAEENLLTIKPEGDFAKQHRALIDAANVMLAAPELLEALRGVLRVADRATDEFDAARAAIAKATAP
jgi:hypothetical protein